MWGDPIALPANDLDRDVELGQGQVGAKATDGVHATKHAGDAGAPVLRQQRLGFPGLLLVVITCGHCPGRTLSSLGLLPPRRAPDGEPVPG